MTKAITLRLDDDDHRALTRQAEQLRIAPGTLARILVHAGLGEDTPVRDAAAQAIARLVGRSRDRPSGDAVIMVEDARTALGPLG